MGLRHVCVLQMLPWWLIHTFSSELLADRNIFCIFWSSSVGRVVLHPFPTPASSAHIYEQRLLLWTVKQTATNWLERQKKHRKKVHIEHNVISLTKVWNIYQCCSKCKLKVPVKKKIVRLGIKYSVEMKEAKIAVLALD